MAIDAAAPEPPVERLQIERRGGLAGLRPAAECDVASLTSAQQGALHSLFAARSGSPAMLLAAGADRFGYRFRWIGPGDVERTLEVPEDALPAVLARLVRPALP